MRSTIKASKSRWLLPALLLTLFLASVLLSQELARLLAAFLPHKEIFAERTPLPILALQHIMLVAAASGLALLVAVGVAILTRLPSFQHIKTYLLHAASFGQTIPTVAVLAILVPVLGYGLKPILFALFLYGVLPVLRNTIEGLDTVPAEITESAKAMGMNTLQTLFLVELPMARPAMMAGLQTSIILNISVATVGAVVGVNGFGTLIINGIRADDIVLLLKGAIPVALLALTVDSLFSAGKQRNIM